MALDRFGEVILNLDKDCNQQVYSVKSYFLHDIIYDNNEIRFHRKVRINKNQITKMNSIREEHGEEFLLKLYLDTIFQVASRTDDFYNNPKKRRIKPVI